MNILKKSAVISAMVLFLCAGIGAGNGACEDKGDEAKIIVKEEDSTAENIRNFICPVSEDDIDKANCIKVEYKGKIYNLCCDACAKHFIKYPEKFSQKAASIR